MFLPLMLILLLMRMLMLLLMLLPMLMPLLLADDERDKDEMTVLVTSMSDMRNGIRSNMR